MIWWKKLLAVFAIFAVWFCGLIVVGELGYPSQYFYASGSAAAIGFGVAPFWRHRASDWYWPTVLFLVLANLAILYLEQPFVSQRDLPPKGIVQLLFLVDCLLSWGLMIAACWTVQRKLPWQISEQ